MASNPSLQFEIVTPERVVLKREVAQVSVPTQDGEITVLPGHIPLVSVLKPGVIEARLSDGQVELMAVSGGFIEVMPEKIVILADTAERAEELDEARIAEAQKRAEELKSGARREDAEEFAELSAKIEKELARSNALNKWRRLKNINSGK